MQACITIQWTKREVKFAKDWVTFLVSLFFWTVTLLIMKCCINILLHFRRSIFLSLLILVFLFLTLSFHTEDQLVFMAVAESRKWCQSAGIDILKKGMTRNKPFFSLLGAHLLQMTEKKYLNRDHIFKITAQLSCRSPFQQHRFC